MLDSKTDCPVLIVLGQSNAHAHATLLPPEDRITVPMKNVFGLSREQNQAYGLSRVTWSGYLSAGMNLGETQDHTCSLATEFAKLWQHRIDSGEALPDLFIIQISVGAQGVLPDDVSPDGKVNMWWPERPRVLKPGPLGTANISLYPLTQEILSLSIQSIREMGKKPVILGLHWNQWESEVCFGMEHVKRACCAYPDLWRGFAHALGTDFPLFLYRPLTSYYPHRAAQAEMAAWFAHLAEASGQVRLLDPSCLACWDPDTFDHGIFQPDGVHYLPSVHSWFALQQMEFLRRQGEVL